MTNEEKADNFRKAAAHRTNAVIGRIRWLGTTANRSRYQYTKTQTDQVLAAIEQELQKVRLAFDRWDDKQLPFEW